MSQRKPAPDREPSTAQDDAVIGQAFRWSVLALVLMAAAGLVLYLVNRQTDTAAVRLTQLSPPETPEHLAVEVPAVRFTDVTRERGIAFVHINGAYGDKLLPETMGGGVAFFDFDNDGDQDLLFVNSTYWPWKIPAGKAQPTMALYRNDRQGHFTDVTAGSGLDVSFYGMGVAIADYDNDGLPDVFVTAVGGNHLFHSEGNAKFREVTAAAGVSGSPTEWSTSATWIDYDNDGRLDLFVCNYVRWSRQIDFEVDYKFAGIGRAYGPPLNFPGSFPCLYHNEGNGRFTEVSATSGIQVKNRATGLPMAKSLGVAPVDLDGDGWMDLVVANDTVQNFVFHNERNGTFKEVGAVSGIAFDSYGRTRGAMGIDAARFQADNNLGILIGNFANEMAAFYVSQRGQLLFTDEAIGQGIGLHSRLALTFGVFFFDYDLDGWLDLLTANGHIEEEINKVLQSQRYRQPAQLYWNRRGAGTREGFVLVPPEKCGSDLLQPIVGRGSAYADIDGDGDLDVVLTQVNGPPLLLRNDQRLGHHWLRFKLVGLKCNRDAIGAGVKIRVGDQTFSRQVMPTRGYLSQSELPVTFGLGSATRVDEVVVTWPEGSTQKVQNPRMDGLTVVTQGR